ncbi:MAG: FliI/YscN family ATPase [Pseudomonadota bacterium]
MQLELAAMRAATVDAGPVLTGRVVACDGGLVEVAGLPLPVGSLGAIARDGGGESLAEVIGFRSGHSLMMLLGDTVLLRPEAEVRGLGRPGEVQVGEALLGRAVDGLGAPIDGGPALGLSHSWPLGGRRDHALERSPVREPFDCGVRAINALATMGVGQRLGVIAGSGVGKSVLIDTIVSHASEAASADVTVVALIGERAREVSDFVARHMSRAQGGRMVVVAVPADHAPNLRLRAAQYASAIAEYFRSTGKRVLLLLDSLTRVAHAARELALVLGEPGAARGYPPSALAAVTRLVERAGNSARSGGSVTGLFTVLADGDDTNDPVVDTARAILDGHILLSRDLAQRGHYPAIDVSASLSRVMDDLVSADVLERSRRVRALIAAREENRDLVLMGAYRAGSDPVLDTALERAGELDGFLQQARGQSVSLAESHAQLVDLT